MPTGVPPGAAVITVTPVGKWPSTWRYLAESKVAGSVIDRRGYRPAGGLRSPRSGVGDHEPFAGGQDLVDAGAGGQAAGMGDDRVHGGVVMRGIVMEEGQPSGPALL